MGYDLKRRHLAFMFPQDVKMPEGIEDLRIIFTSGRESITAVTEPITITSEHGDIADLGRFRIELPLSRIESRFDIRISPLNKRHPHISENLPCWGDRNIALLGITIDAGDWEALLSICVEFLKSYNPAGSYFMLFGERHCPLCEARCFDDDVLSCPLCGSSFCHSCGEDVETLEGGRTVSMFVCPSCSEDDDNWCDECELFVIEGSHCQYCGRLIHDGCLESHEENCEEKPHETRELQLNNPAS